VARIFITGSADGLGRMAGGLLAGDGHEVVLHARNAARGRDALAGVPGAAGVVIGDLASLAGMRTVADGANTLGRFDAVIHNAAVGYREPRRIATADGLPHVLAINSLAPYVLTALMTRPARLVYVSSGLHRSGDATLQDLAWTRRA
jgi:NAD(P)-dependent dehydrogenase (short-subunit alcohol dehydrogenase family)